MVPMETRREVVLNIVASELGCLMFWDLDSRIYGADLVRCSCEEWWLPVAFSFGFAMTRQIAQQMAGCAKKFDTSSAQKTISDSHWQQVLTKDSQLVTTVHPHRRSSEWFWWCTIAGSIRCLWWCKMAWEVMQHMTWFQIHCHLAMHKTHKMLAPQFRRMIFAELLTILVTIRMPKLLIWHLDWNISCKQLFCHILCKTFSTILLRLKWPSSSSAYLLALTAIVETSSQCYCWQVWYLYPWLWFHYLEW